MRRIPQYSVFFGLEKIDLLFSRLKFTLPATSQNPASSFLYSFSWLLCLSKWLQTDEQPFSHICTACLFLQQKTAFGSRSYSVVTLLSFHFYDSFTIYFKPFQMFTFDTDILTIPEMASLFFASLNLFQITDEGIYVTSVLNGKSYYF